MKPSTSCIIAATFLSIGVAIPRVALAECIYRQEFANKGTRVIDVGTVLVPQTAAVGSVVGSTNLPTIWLESAWCFAPGGTMTTVASVLWGNLVPGMDRVYSTNIPGIGYRLHGPYGVLPYTKTENYSVPSGDAALGVSAGWNFRLNLIKTAPRVGNGPLDRVPLVRVDSQAGPSEPYIVLQAGDIRILAPSCQVGVGSRNQTVTLGQEFRNRFRGVGSTTASKDFQVVVNCHASPNGIESTVSLTMDATPDPSGAPGVLGIDTGTGTASGVGIQVLDKDGQPVAFGQPKQLGQSKDGDYVLPFKARYYQVAGSVSNGKADGRATITLSYK